MTIGTYRQPSMGDAIAKLRPNTVWSINMEDYSTLWWSETNEQDPPDLEDVQAELTRQRNEFASLEYSREREEAYDSIKDQLDQLYHDMRDGLLGAAATTGSWYVGITSVKTAWPKPIVGIASTSNVGVATT